MKRTNIGVFVTLASALVSGAAIAQDNVLEEIIVTAERREQNLQDVPLSITAFGDKTRDRVGILTIQSMADFAPGVSYNTALDRPSIRGIGRQSNTFSLDSPVANYIDGVYTSSVQDAQRRPLFIDRTEILRGPQGALSGRGSIAGAINTINKRPDDEFGGEVRVSGGDYARYIVDATVTGPLLGDWLRGRLNLGVTRQDEGYFENVANGLTEGDQPNNRETLDLLLDADLGENVDMFLKLGGADYDETRRTLVSTAPYVSGTQGAPTAYASPGLVPSASFGYFDSTAIQVGTQTQNPVITTGDLRKFNDDFPSRQTLTDHHNYTLELVWHAPIFDLKYIGAHQNYEYNQWTDADNTPVQSYILPGTVRRVEVGGVSHYREEREWYSNEINLTSTGDGAIEWILGLYQSHEDYNQQPQTLTYPGYAELETPLDPVGFTPVSVNSLGRVPQVGMLDGITISSAVFGQVDYSFNNEWKFTVGFRYNKDEKEVSEATRFVYNNAATLAGAFGGAFPLALDITATLTAPYSPTGPLPEGVVADYGFDDPLTSTGFRRRDLKNDWDALTGSVGVDYTPNDNDLFYFRAARGYRPGGFDAGFIADKPQVNEESLNAFEIGWKTTLFDQLQLSTSAFFYDYTDIQLPFSILARCTNPSDLSTCRNVNTFLNLPSAESKGLEIEGTWAPNENWNFLFTYGYLDAKIKDGLEGTGFLNSSDPAALSSSANRYLPTGAIDSGYTFLPTYTQDLSGNSLANSPKHKVALNGSYTMDLGAGNLTLSLSYNWRDTQYNDLFESELGESPSYHLVGFRAIWNDTNDRYTVIVFGSNLTNEDAADSAILQRQRTGLATAGSPSAAGQAYYRGLNLLFPREYGVELQYRF